jgi:hypothetical protein
MGKNGVAESRMGVHASIAVCMTAMISPASEPKPRMRSSCALTSVFMKPCFSPIACALSTALVGSPAMAPQRLDCFASASLSPTWASGGSAVRPFPEFTKPLCALKGARPGKRRRERKQDARASEVPKPGPRTLYAAPNPVSMRSHGMTLPRQALALRSGTKLLRQPFSVVLMIYEYLQGILEQRL